MRQNVVVAQTMDLSDSDTRVLANSSLAGRTTYPCIGRKIGRRQRTKTPNRTHRSLRNARYYHGLLRQMT